MFKISQCSLFLTYLNTFPSIKYIDTANSVGLKLGLLLGKSNVELPITEAVFGISILFVTTVLNNHHHVCSYDTTCDLLYLKTRESEADSLQQHVYFVLSTDVCTHNVSIIRIRNIVPANISVDLIICDIQEGIFVILL